MAQGARRAAVSDEERRRNRKNSNRLSARKSRMKRQQHVDELTTTAERLGRENEAMRGSIDEATRRCRLLEQENRVLAAHARELCATLMLRNSQLRGVLGNVAEVPAIPDHLMQLYGGGDMQMMMMPAVPSPPAPAPLPVPMMMENQQTLFWPDAMFEAAVGMLGF